ncbi:MAG: hypothetical protein IJN50_05885 [Clostridia bacterium]|nr:hypothetical protein [Clostridia bacterium]
MLNTEENIIGKLNYIGLDLNNIPTEIMEFKNLEFRPKNSEEIKYYKVYKYVNVKDIKILISPTNRLDAIETRYSKASPIYEYLDSENEENTEKHTMFLKMLNDININDIEYLEEKQKNLKNHIPFEIKFSKDYLWQVYYSENTNQYFMLAPINDSEHEALFYVLKKQLENRNEKIFIPICYENYSQEYLKQKEIEEIERELWLFAKEWPITYEVYNVDNQKTISIVGKANIYENIKSLYKIELTNKDEAFQFYKLLKALFILQTELPHYYKFTIKINDKGGIEFFHQNKDKIQYENLASFIKHEYIKAMEKSVKTRESKINLEKTIKILKEQSKQLEEEYLFREKQISTFLDCKKTFFGKVKYFFKYKKIVEEKQENKTKEQAEVNKQKIHYCERQEIKENYTLEEIITICKQLDVETIQVRNLELDIEALKSKNQKMEVKIKNSIKYIKEIDNHKKSIFDFWRFTNQESLMMLNEGEALEENKKHLKRVFNYEMDIEDVAKKIDAANRNTLSNEELDSIFIASTDIIKDINAILEDKFLTEENLNNLKQQALKEEKLVSKEDFDIFGGFTNNTEIKNISSKQHREKKRDKFTILGITQDTTLEEYVEKIKFIINNIEEALKKIQNEIEMPIYMIGKEMNKRINVFDINAERILEDIKKMETEEINLYKVILKEKSNLIGLSNIIYYYNINKTLPLGMDEAEKVLIDKEKLELELINEDYNNIVYDENGKIVTKKICIFEYK